MQGQFLAESAHAMTAKPALLALGRYPRCLAVLEEKFHLLQGLGKCLIAGSLDDIATAVQVLARFDFVRIVGSAQHNDRHPPQLSVLPDPSKDCNAVDLGHTQIQKEEIVDVRLA